MAEKKADIGALRARFTMTLGQVVEELGYPNRETLRRHLASKKVRLSRVKFGSATSPYLYDPKEVAKLAEDLAAAVIVEEAS